MLRLVYSSYSRTLHLAVLVVVLFSVFCVIIICSGIFDVTVAVNQTVSLTYKVYRIVAF